MGSIPAGTVMLNVSVFRDKKSPLWMTQVVLPNGRRVKRSTKVPADAIHSPKAAAHFLKLEN